MKRGLSVFLVCVLIGQFCLADIVFMKNGKKLECTIIKKTATHYVVTHGGKKYRLKIEDVDSVMESEAEGAAPTSSSQGEPALGNDCLVAKARGEADAENAGGGGYMGCGLAGGFLLGLIGLGVTYATASGSRVEMPQTIMLDSSRSDSYKLCYMEGYRAKAIQKRKSAALTGGLIGTLIAVGVVVGLSS